MKQLYKEIIEEKKRLEFNMTEGEILNKLVHDAHKLSNETKQLFRILDNAVKSILDTLPSYFIVKNTNASSFSHTAIGIDGSFQVIGGMGGIWYVPLSSVRIVFKNGLDRDVDSKYFATIRKIEAIDESQAKKYASYLMLYLESSEIRTIADEKISDSNIFLDGPIIDPPFMVDNPYVDPREYTSYRTSAIYEVLKNGNRVLGCVKRIRDRKLIEHISQEFPELNSMLNKFHNDLYLIATMFKFYRFKLNPNYVGPLSTMLTEEIPQNEIELKYSEKGIKIYYLFYQRNARSPILRIEIATKSQLTQEELNDVIEVLNYWTIPGHGLPIPALLAHEKCTIREGCAQVLYEEIITKESATSPIFNLWIR